MSTLNPLLSLSSLRFSLISLKVLCACSLTAFAELLSAFISIMIVVPVIIISKTKMIIMRVIAAPVLPNAAQTG